MKRSVPKFASFRSKEQASTKDEGSVDAEHAAHLVASSLNSKQSRSIESTDNHGESRHKHHTTRSRGHHHGRPTNERKQSLLIPLRKAEPTAFDETPFLVDIIGDPKNQIYGALHRHAVPKYLRSGAGSVVGSTPNNKIDRSTSNEKTVVFSGNSLGLPNKREKNAFSRLNKIGMRKLRIRSEEDHCHDVDAAADFVPLGLARDNKGMQGRDGNTSDSSEPSNGTVGHFRSIDGKAKALSQPDDEDLLYGSDVSVSNDECAWQYHFDEPMQRKRTELVCKTEEDPTNADAWLDLIAHQDEMLRMRPDYPESKLSNAEMKSNADVKISIYEKAIEMVLDPRAREQLLVGLMNEGSKVWETSKLSYKWRLWLRSYPEYLALWIKYLDYKQTTFSSFNYEESRSIYLECLDVLQRARTREELAQSKSNILFENQVYVLMRMTVFMREAGFTENSVAAWQAILEWQMFRPTRLQSREYAMAGSKAPEALSAFEDFWESEVPRIGETGAEGWASFVSDGLEPSQPLRDTDVSTEDGAQNLDAWAGSERRKALQSRIIARTVDEVDESDPYRVTLFSDVRGFLIDPPASSSGLALVFQALLIFCHLPPLPTELAKNPTKLWQRDPFLRNEVLHRSYDELSAWRAQNAGDAEDYPGADGVFEDLSLTKFYRDDPFSFPTSDYQISLDSLFAAQGTWFSAFDAWRCEYAEDHGPLKAQWIRRTLEAIVQQGSNDDFLAEYYLAFELNISPITVKKAAKSLIKRRPDSLRLYNAYALLEYRLGNISGAEHVVATAINTALSLKEAKRQDVALLWHTRIWELLCHKGKRQALECLSEQYEGIVNVNLPEHHKDALLESNTTGASFQLRIRNVGVSSLPSTKLLTTEQGFATARDHLLALSSQYQAMHYANLLILFAYLTTSSLSATLSTFHQNLALVTPSSPAHELLHQSFSRLLYYHATHTPSFSPSIVRSSIAESIKAYPKNTIFLSLYAWIESRFRIDDRVRSIMKDVVFTTHLGNGRERDPPSVVSHFFAIYTELRRSLTLGSNINTIRATFERAVREDSIGVHSAGLWKLYFLFERERGDKKKVKEVFWRAIRACPWAKELYMLAFDGEGKTDRGVGLSEVELIGVIELMEDKGLRLHARVDDLRKMTA